MLAVDGNIASSNGIGLSIDQADTDGKAEAIITGTISGEYDGVHVYNTSEKVDLTVWKIEAEKPVVVIDGGLIDEDETNEFIKTINYIVKVEQPTKGATIKATKADGSDLDQKIFREDETFDVAKGGDKVLLAVNLEDHYKITGAYNGDGEKVDLLMDDDGHYYVIVPPEGGIYLSVDVAEKESYPIKFVNDDGTELQNSIIEEGMMPKYLGKTPEKKSTAQYDFVFKGWTPEINPVTGEMTYTAAYNEILRKYGIKYDLGGGTYNGQSGVIAETHNYGDVISILGTPTRPGYKFLYWKGSQYNPGDKYTVNGEHTFTAVWEPVVIPDKKDKANTSDDIKTASLTPVVTTKASPQTGDDNALTLMFLMFMSCVMLTGVSRKEQIKNYLKK
jgi:hypothetical protein